MSTPTENKRTGYKLETLYVLIFYVYAYILYYMLGWDYVLGVLGGQQQSLSLILDAEEGLRLFSCVLSSIAQICRRDVSVYQ